MSTQSPLATNFFADHFNPRLCAAIEAAGYTHPTPIQTESIPHVLEGRDLLGLAQTGTGKTAAFALPILERLQRRPEGPISALVIAPTRELADQIDEHIRRFSRGSIRSTTIYGGVPMAGQLRALRARPRIVVACPGRLLDHIEQRTIDLRAVEVLVLDEADHMFDMGFLPTLRRVLRNLPRERQNLLFSATMPKEIRALAMEVLRDPVTVQVDRTAPPKTVAHAIYPVQPSDKAPLLLKLLSQAASGSVLVFCRTKHRAKKLAVQLVDRGHRATCLQGNLSQSQRRRALEGFREGSYRIMVATDIAARGIDVSSVSHVINFDIPDTVEAYIHRIGRTGRAARNGDAYTLVTDEDRQMVQAIERVLGSRLERRTHGAARAAVSA